MFKCTACQKDQEPAPPPYDLMPPSSCSSCGGPVTMIRDTTPAPPGDEAPPVPPAPPAPPEGMTAEEGVAWAATGALPARFNPAEPSLPPPEPLDLIRRGELVPTGPRIFVSTMLYGLSRELGSQQAVAEPELAVAYTLANAMRRFDVQLLVDAGATSIGKARSRAAHAFIQSGLDVWVSCDDDVEGTEETIAALVEAVQGSPAVCIAPCFLRERPVANVQLVRPLELRELQSGAKVCKATAGGFGLVAISREALLAIGGRVFVDDDGAEKVALFVEGITDRKWYGEDLAFFQRLPGGVRVEALLIGHTAHAGQELELASLLSLVGQNDKSEQKQDAGAPLEASEQV